MKTWTRNSLLTVLAVIFCCSLFAGCENNNAAPETPSTKMSRLIAVENAELKRKIANQKGIYDKRLANQKKLSSKETKRLNNALDNCKKETQSLQEISNSGIESYMSDIVGPLIDENNKLTVEIKNLKGQIELLKAQVGQLKENP